jgi:NDP-sugar pyrophosphorylase family protein
LQQVAAQTHYQELETDLKAMILAAGVGSRLDPLTRAVPKPMAPIANKPVIEHIIRLLARHGFDDIFCNTYHLADSIEDYFNAKSPEELGARVRFNREKELMGTAGGVKRVAEEQDFFTDETFLVSGGDDLTALDLTEMLRFHKESGAVATIALTRVEDPSQFGVVVLDESASEEGGRIQRFVEKPAPGTAPSNLINTGVYIFEPQVLELIPHGQFYDFGKELFPLLLEKGVVFCGYETKAYWRDVGNLTEYRDCHDDFFAGAIELHTGLSADADGNYIGENVEMGEGARIEAPCMIGAGTKIGAGAVIAKRSVIGENCIIEDGASISHSILWDGTSVGAGTKLEKSIVGNGAKVSSEGVTYGAVVVREAV